MLCKHQDNCEREMKVLGRRSKGIIASGLAGTHEWIDPKMLTNMYLPEKEAILLASSI